MAMVFFGGPLSPSSVRLGINKVRPRAHAIFSNDSHAIGSKILFQPCLVLISSIVDWN